MRVVSNEGTYIYIVIISQESSMRIMIALAALIKCTLHYLLPEVVHKDLIGTASIRR